jgi:formiminotetrahydrofolate cyclodeaminase
MGGGFLFSKGSLMVDTTFVDELASSAPTPGGGGAAAYCGALAAALATMVTNLTVGKKTYADVEDEIREVQFQLDELRDELFYLIDADAQAFLPLSAAYKLPRTTPEEAEAKQKAMQTALVEATEVPLRIMKACAAVIDLTEIVARKGSRLAISDAGAAAVLGQAALRSASLNVLINAKDFEDKREGSRYAKAAEELLTFYVPKAEAIVEYVFLKVRG